MNYMRKDPFVNGEYYHVYNRGVDKRKVFLDKKDLGRFLQSMNIFNREEPVGSIYEFSLLQTRLGRPTSKLVNIICYCLNPNHFHMILEQITKNGVSEFMKRLGGGYTKYFNARYTRSGALFQGRFKSTHVKSNEYLLHLSAYINLNNRVHHIKTPFYNSSWEEYVNEKVSAICTKNIILEQFKNRYECKNFAESSLKDIVEQRDLSEELELLLIET